MNTEDNRDFIEIIAAGDVEHSKLWPILQQRLQQFCAKNKQLKDWEQATSQLLKQQNEPLNTLSQKVSKVIAAEHMRTAHLPTFNVSEMLEDSYCWHRTQTNLTDMIFCRSDYVDHIRQAFDLEAGMLILQDSPDSHPLSRALLMRSAILAYQSALAGDEADIQMNKVQTGLDQNLSAVPSSFEKSYLYNLDCLMFCNKDALPVVYPYHLLNSNFRDSTLAPLESVAFTAANTERYSSLIDYGKEAFFEHCITLAQHLLADKIMVEDYYAQPCFQDAMMQMKALEQQVLTQ